MGQGRRARNRSQPGPAARGERFIMFGGLEFLIPAIVAIGLFGWILYQRRQIQQLEESSQRARREKEAVLALMDTIGERMTRKIDMDQALEAIAQYVVEATGAESGAIFLIDDVQQTLSARVVVGLFPPFFDDESGVSQTKYQAERIRSHKIKIGEGIIGLTAEQNKPLLIADAEADPRVPRSAWESFPLHSIVLCPMRTRGRALGVIAIVNKQGEQVFDARDTFLLQALADQAAITVELVKLYDVLARQQKLEQELSIAQDFQKMLLPQRLPELPDFEFAAVSDSALVVGGDFYDFFPIGQDHLGIVIGDVSGKGIPGALIMAMVRSILRAEARDTVSPKRTLARVNRGLLKDTKENVFVTITYGILDLTNRRFRFARAGHEPILMKPADEKKGIAAMRPEGMAVGLMPSEIFDQLEEMEIQLEPGDTILLYTDGAIEAENAAQEEFGRERLLRLLGENAAQGPSELLKAISEDVHRYALGVPQHDDITMVALRMRPAAETAQGAAPAGEIRAEQSA